MSDSAPEPLRVIEDFVNTRSVEFRTDDVADPAALSAWLHERGLLADDVAPSAAEHGRALRVREGLRALIARNIDETEPADSDDDGDGEADGIDPTALDDLGELARNLPLIVDVGSPAPHLVPRAGSPLDQVLAGFLAAVAWSVADGTWQRFKVCRETNCRWAYYDHSRNRSRAWCDMTTCGNRAKARAFRQRPK